MKIYAFNNGGSPGWYQAIALGEDGQIVGEHICSHEAWVPHDLGADGRSNWQHDNYDKVYGKGNWTIKYIKPNEIEDHSGLKEAIEKAKVLAEPFKCARAGATVTLVDDAGKETEHHVGA